MYENNQHELFNFTPALLQVIDTDLAVIAISNAFLQATMKERNEVINQNIFEVFPINPDDKSADGEKNIRASFDHVFKNKVTDILPFQKYDIKKPASDGGGFEIKYWKVTHSPVITIDGSVKYIIQHAEDITENQELMQSVEKLKKNNEQLKESYDFSEAIVASMHETLLILNNDFQVKSASKSYHKKFLSTKKEVRGKSLFELGDGMWDNPKLRDLFNNILTDNNNFKDFEIKLEFPSIGEKIMILNASRIIKKKLGKELILFTIKDITEVRRLGFELQLKEKKNSSKTD